MLNSDVSDNVPTLAEFELLRILGEGGFGKVVLARHLKSDKSFALKCIQKDRVSNETLFAEKDMLIKVQGPYTPRLYGTFQSDLRVYFLMERLYTDLLKVMVETMDGPLPEDSARFYIGQLALAVEFLHSRDVIHRDIKLDNILVDHEGYLRLADFGLANQGLRANNYVGTPEYVAPEMVAGKEYGKEVDWWALGVILYVMLSYQFPFVDDDEHKQRQNISRAQFPCLRNVSKSGRRLLRGFLTKCPRSRTQSFETVRDHRWFREFQWSGIAQRTAVAPVRPPSDLSERISLGDKLAMESLMYEPTSTRSCDFIPNFDFVDPDL